jgi:tetratricopeptide (TPR) repeat protein
MKLNEPTQVAGIRYFLMPEGVEVTGLDQKVRIPGGDLPLPLLEADHTATAGTLPTYDVIGRGLFHLLRANPDCAFGERYARLLQEGYPHYISELASQILMLDKKDLDVAYLDRKINYLKVFALIEPGNSRFPLEIGLTFMEKGLSLSALQLTTLSLYRAEEFLRKALLLAPEDPSVRYQLGEVCYILGKYEDVLSCWNGILVQPGGEEMGKIEARLGRIRAGVLPRVPVVDYLEAIGAALACHQQGESAEAAAILIDILDDAVFSDEFPVPQIYYILGLCSSEMGMPRYAEDYYREALQMNPEFEDARNALANLCR